MKLNIFNRKNVNFEVTMNPTILYNSKTSVGDIQVHGLKLGDASALIDQDNVLTTTFEQNPFGITSFTWKDNKTFYHTDNGLVEYLLKDRIKSVLENGGILHMKTGAKFVIREQTIVGIGIHNGILKPYSQLKKSQIEKKFGKADNVKENFEDIDGTLFNTEFIYINRQMKILFDDWNKRISLINIGKFND